MARTIAIFSPKGGVGKTTLAVNLADAAARSGRRTLLWDLDAQGAATWLVGGEAAASDEAAAVFAKVVKPGHAIRPTATERLDLLPADASLAALDRLFHTIDKRKRLAKLVAEAGRDHDRLILDCPPGLSDTADQILRAADLVIVPVVPAPLAQRAFAMMAMHVDGMRGGAGRLMPVFSMADRRRTLHRDAIAGEPDWPVVPMASVVEQASLRRQAVAATQPDAAVARAFAALWAAIEKRLAALDAR